MQLGSAKRTPSRLSLTLVLTLAFIASGLVMAAPALAHHSEISATTDCAKKVTFTATSWNGPDTNSKTNSEIGIFYSTNNGASYTRLPHKTTYQFNSSNGFTFTDSFQLPDTVTQVKVAAQAIRNWANGAAPGGATYTGNMTFPTCPDVQVVKTDSPDPVAKDGNITYTIVAKNNGSTTASAVVVEDQLPSGAELIGSPSTTKGSCSVASGKVTCAIGSLAAGEFATVTIKVKAKQCGTISNTATVKGNEVEDVTSNNTSTVSTTVQCDERPDLKIVKTDSPDPITFGGHTTYTIGVTNLGPGNATDVTVTDVLEDDVWYVSHTIDKGSCTKVTATINCEIGDLAAGHSATITITVRIEDCRVVHNTATVEAHETEVSMANNSSTATTTVTCDEEDPDLEILKVDNYDPIEAGGELIYTVTVRNLGTATAHNVVVTDTIQHPSWRLWEPPSSSKSGATCSPSDADTGDVIVCDLGDIAGGETVTLTFKVKARLCELMRNTAIVSADESDPNPSNNSATETTVIDGKCDIDPDMSVVTEAPARTRIGDIVAYKLKIHQGGPEHGTGINVVNRLDKTMEFVSATASQGTCTTAGQRVHCDLGEMAVFTDASITILAMATKAGVATNRAEVDVNEYDADLSNNVSISETKVRAPKTKAKLFRASADATIYKSAPERNKGKDPAVGADSRTLKRMLVRFDVDGLRNKRILSATLRLYNVDRSPSGGAVHGMTDSSWNENSVTWNSAPGFSGVADGHIGSTETGTWYEVDVSDLVLGEGAVSFAVVSSDADGVWYASRDGGRSHAPQLILSLVSDSSASRFVK